MASHSCPVPKGFAIAAINAADMRNAIVAAVAAFFVFLVSSPASADAPRISYTLAMPDPAAHVFHITMRVDGVARPTSVVRMPIWIPGYYGDDQYGRNVFDFAATDGSGKALAYNREGQSAYRIDTAGATAFTVRYALFADRNADIGT